MKVCQVFLSSDVNLSWPCFFLRALLSSTLPLIKSTLIKSLSSCTDLSYFLLFPIICFFISLLHHPSIPHILPHSHFPTLVLFCPYVPLFYSFSSPTIFLSLHPSAYPLLSTSLPRSLLLSITSFNTPCHSLPLLLNLIYRSSRPLPRVPWVRGRCIRSIHWEFHTVETCTGGPGRTHEHGAIVSSYFKISIGADMTVHADVELHVNVNVYPLFSFRVTFLFVN